MIKSETYQGVTFFWQDDRIVGHITVMSDCVGIGKGEKFVVIPTELWNSIVDQYEPSRT